MSARRLLHEAPWALFRRWEIWPHPSSVARVVVEFEIMFNISFVFRVIAAVVEPGLLTSVIHVQARNSVSARPPNAWFTIFEVATSRVETHSQPALVERCELVACWFAAHPNNPTWAQETAVLAKQADEAARALARDRELGA